MTTVIRKIALSLPSLPSHAMAMPTRRRTLPVPISRFSAAALMPIYEDDATLAFPTTTGLPLFSFEPIYRVMLHYTNWTDTKDVTKRVKRAVPVVPITQARNAVEAAEKNGTSILVTAPLDDAAMYEIRLTQAGLKVSLELA